jgi:hypothetical protein
MWMFLQVGVSMWPLVIMPLAWTSLRHHNGRFWIARYYHKKNPTNVEAGKLVLGQGVKHDNEVHDQIECSTKGVDGN